MAPKAAAGHIKRSVCASQPASRQGPGVHFLSPLKTRDGRKNRPVAGVGRAGRIRGLQSKLDTLLARDSAPNASVVLPEDGPDFEDVPTGDIDMDENNPVAPPPAPAFIPPIPRPKPATSAAERLNTAWNVLLPSLERPYALYTSSNYGQRPTQIPSSITYECPVACGFPVSAKVQCLYISHLEQNGVFPASPTRVQTGVSIDMLEIYRALFERSCDAITALASALHTIYERRGFRVLGQKNIGQLATDPFRKLLGHAVLWYSNIKEHINLKLNAALTAAEHTLSPPNPAGPSLDAGSSAPEPSDVVHPVHQDARRGPGMETPETAATQPPPGPDVAQGVDSDAGGGPEEPPDPDVVMEDELPERNPSDAPADPAPTPASTPAPAPPPAPPPLAPGRASWALRERCPACFGLEEWGRSLRDGGDVQLGADGCFSYRHLRAAGDGPISYDPTYFVSKEKVAKVNNRILEARKRKSTNYKPCIPQEALDACQESWNAANEKKQKADPKYYDASGVFVLTCRHSQVIFLCDIDTPGEQQKYIVALMEEVNSHLPPQATILQAYDVGCVTDHSFNLFPILTEGFRERVSFIINAMHAFGHRWVCQLVYSPRCHDGVGLSDMEGVEQLWSRIRKLIPLTRAQWNSRRIWTIDQYTSFVNQEGLDGLGGWLHRQLAKNLPKKRQAAAKTLSECGVPEAELREQWQAQKLAQTSARSHAPVRLRRELDKVLKLQDQIDAVEKSIHEAKQSLTGGTAPADSLTHIRHLQSTHETLSSQAEALYASLNIHDSFPELRGLPLDFVRTLIIMRDLKMNIRDCAIESFYEWETLDRAVAGR
ncbi:hypothetical protein B0H14DRAFT_3434081 [Mycena olivaceomarginata]|nr:hypothetical protein B0H14DRAFT_3434081 [Mycena olivaceomarginata]